MVCTEPGRVRSYYLSFIGENMMSGLDLEFAGIFCFLVWIFSFCEVDIVSVGSFVFRLIVLI